MPVGVMLKTMSSRELAQWAAYETVSGPLGEQYSDATLASLYDSSQLTNYLLGAIYASWTEGTNPIPKPEMLKRPNQIFTEESAPEIDDPEDGEIPKGYVSWQDLAVEIAAAQGETYSYN